MMTKRTEFVNKLVLFAICLFLFTISPISQTAVDIINYEYDFKSQAENPEESYVHLERIYSINLITGPRRLQSFAAGGVCVSSDADGCYVVTVNHFCEENKASVPNLPNVSESLIAQNMFDSITENVEIIDMMPEADLCLIRVNGQNFREARGITIPHMNERFSKLQNFGAPAGHFSGNILWNLSMYEGRWSGYCTPRCLMPDSRIEYENLISHTIPTTRGQSGSPIFVGDVLFGVQVATNEGIEDFGIAASSRAIYLLLERNSIYMEFLGIEEQR